MKKMIFVLSSRDDHALNISDESMYATKRSTAHDVVTTSVELLDALRRRATQNASSDDRDELSACTANDLENT